MRTILIYACLALMLNSTTPFHLGLLRKGQSAVVQGLTTSGGDDADSKALTLRLAELGFVADERVRVVAESFPRGDPIAVRIGNTTFALRRHEAERILVTPDN